MTTRNPTQRGAPTYSGPQTAFDGNVRPLDRPDLRQRARQAYQIGDVFHRISDFAQEKATEHAVATAQRDAATQGVSSKKITVMRGGKPTEIDVPLLVRKEGTGATAQAWNRAAETAYAMRIDTATMQHIQAAALDHPADPDGFREALKGWHSSMKELVPPDLQARYEHDLFAMAQPLITRAETDLMRNIARDQAIDAGIYADELVGTMVVNSSLGAEGGLNSAAQFNKYVEATMGRIGPFYSEAEAELDMRNVLARAAAGSLQAQFEGAPNKQAMWNDFQAGKPVVSLPAVGEDGKVHPGLYDKNTLIGLVGPEKVQILVNGLAVDIRMQEAEQRAAAAEARAAAREHQAELQRDVAVVFDDAVAEAGATGKTQALTAAEIYAAYGPTKAADKMVAKLALAAQSGSIRKTMATQGPAEDAAMLESLKPKPNTPDFAEQQALYNLAVTEQQAKVKALETDPATYVMQTSDAVQADWEAAGDGSDPAKVKQAVATTKQAQIDLGVPPEKVQPMTTAQAAGLASTLNTAAPDTIAATVDGITAGYGDDAWGQIIAAGASPTVRAVAFADDPRLGAWRQAAIEASKVKESVLVDQAKARGYSGSDVDDALEGMTAPLQDTLPAGVAAPYLDAVRQVALFKVANDGMDPSDAAAFAWSAFASSYSFNGTYRVPVKWDGDKVANGLRTIISRLDGYDIQPAIIGGGMDPAFDKAETIASLKAGHYRWVTDQRETGVILTYEEGTPVLLSDGEPLRIPFDALMVLEPLRPGVDRDLNKGGVQN